MGDAVQVNVMSDAAGKVILADYYRFRMRACS